MAFINPEHEGVWKHYTCVICGFSDYYHENDTVVCKRCGRSTMTRSGPPKDEKEKIRRDRQAGFY